MLEIIADFNNSENMSDIITIAGKKFLSKIVVNLIYQRYCDLYKESTCTNFVDFYKFQNVSNILRNSWEKHVREYC